ncbi:DUF1501 domain-containing protein [Bremerella cremea]|uniref:DUF1501 domain-containing protein n=1 Tax=Blastopirellula marina TaxID=124 RepID=A0A2S8G5V1_9BACT|nr:MULTISPECIES: DUF1501 domain-containing protein [Pirellulaceae]PQO39534.1 DUF1501 domain-containing protein [Blastopirellula marina]RCS51001.1 DUF1501 domain-containing protein [Bremerella cremea]
MSGPSHQNSAPVWNHSRLSRREALQAGAVGILGLGMNHLAGLREAQGAADAVPNGKAKKLIFIFLSGGLAQHESFDMKPEAPEDVRGEFKPIATKTPGLQICEHLPQLAQRSEMWSLCRSLTHGSNEHSAGHHIMLTGHSELPTGFSPNSPSRRDRASIAAITGYAMRQRQKNNLPTAVVLPERLVHNSGRVIPGQHAGEMGPQHDPWMIEASPFHNTSYGAFPEYAFDHQERGKKDNRVFQAPQLSLPEGLGMRSVRGRLDLLKSMNRQRRALGHHAQVENFDRLRQGAVSLLTESTVHDALDVTHADEKDLDRYGRNSFGWSLLMARKLVGAGVTLVQVNLGNDETWDTHGNAFPHLKNNLLPPTDKAVSALLDDLQASGELDETMIVMAGEFGRTPRITLLEKHYKLPGRDHWGPLQSVFFAGGGIQGGNVVGKSDAIGAYPIERPVKPENFAATLYSALGIPATAAWYDVADRPHQIYHGEPIAELF